VVHHRDQAGLFVLGGLDEVFATLEDNQVSLMTMLGNRFVLAIQDKVEDWARRLSLLSDTLDEWTQCQRSWMYLESIFAAEDIQKQLPAEAQQFGAIDKSFKVSSSSSSESCSGYFTYLSFFSTLPNLPQYIKLTHNVLFYVHTISRRSCQGLRVTP
jgi:hypothetical protein